MRRKGSDSTEKHQCHANPGFAIYFRHQVGGGHVNRDTRGQWKTSTNPSQEKINDQHAGHRRSGDDDGRGERGSAGVATGQHDGSDSKAFRQFVQKDGYEI